MSKDEVEFIKDAIKRIGMALSSCHNCVATDIVGTEPKKGESWRIDNIKEIGLLDKVESMLFQHE